MSQFYPLANFAGYQFPKSSGGGGGLSFTSVSFPASPTADVNSAYEASSSDPGAGTLAIKNNVDPGDMNNSSGTSDLIYWSGLIGNSFDFADNTHIILRLKIASAPNKAFKLYLGAYDGSAGASNKLQQATGVYGSVQMSNGATGAGSIGDLPVTGGAADSFVNGGNFSVAFSLDGDNDYPRDILIRSESTNPNDFGRQSRQENPTNFSGTNLYWFLGIGANSAFSGGPHVFSSMEIDFLALPIIP